MLVRCFLEKSTQIALHSDLYLFLSPSLYLCLSYSLLGKLVGFAARLMNRSQGPRSRFRTEITRKAAAPCRVFNWVRAEQSRAQRAPHPYLYSYIWWSPSLSGPAQNYYPTNCGKSRQTMRKTLQSQVEKRLDTKAKQSAKKLLLLDAGDVGAWQLHSSPCQLQCFFPTTFSLASFRRLFPASPGESPGNWRASQKL